MNHWKKVFIVAFVAATVVALTLSCFFLLHYETSTAKHYELWIDQTKEVVVNCTVVQIRRNLLGDVVYSRSFEVHRDMSASEALQWIIDTSFGLIEVNKGTYYLDKTVYIDSFTTLDGTGESLFVFEGSENSSMFTGVPNARNMTHW